MIIKTFQYYLIKLFLKRVLISSMIFLSLIFILNIFDEISFFKNVDTNIFYPYLIALLNTPSALFEIFPFIFLIATQFFFIYLIQKGELEVLKVNGLNNFRIINILVLISFIAGILIITFYYTFSSKMKFMYLDLKNAHSDDNKYLAVITKNGLWIKDKINNYNYVVNASKIEDNFLKEVSIFKFNNQFELVETILSSQIDVSKKNWVIKRPMISKENQNINLMEDINILTHFDTKKINSLFRNLTSLNIIQLVNQRKDLKTLSHSTKEIELHLYKLFSFPLFLSIMTAFSSIVMLNIKKNKTVIYHIILGIFLSVLIYYLYYLFNLLGQNEKIPLLLSTFFPLFILSIIILIGLVKINEK